jgi:hypothetical protein
MVNFFQYESAGGCQSIATTQHIASHRILLQRMKPNRPLVPSAFVVARRPAPHRSTIQSKTIAPLLALASLIWLDTASLRAAPASTAANATNTLALDPHLEPMRPLLNRTWRGPFKNSRPDKPVVDILHAERALNGKAVRFLHSINEGSYGGETIYMWNEEKKAVTYHYFTTAGFTTTGTVRFEKDKWSTHEVVSGNSGGTSEVKATLEFQPDGSFLVKTEHLRNGTWEPGRETVYREDPTAKVVFR